MLPCFINRGLRNQKIRAKQGCSSARRDPGERPPYFDVRLHEPVRFENWRIDAVELPAPKPGVETKEGLEHVELVLFDDKDDFLKKYADKQFDLKAANRGVNPEIGFKLPSYGVKFHLLALPTVVYLENKLGMDDIRDGQ